MKKNIQSDNPEKTRLTSKIQVLDHVMIGWQLVKQRSCTWLNRKTSRATVLQMKGLLVIFCGTFVCLSLGVTWHALHLRSGQVNGMVLRPRARMVIAVVPKAPASQNVPPEVYQHVLILRKWLDSLAREDSMRYQQVLVQHPILLSQLQWLDSLHQHENVFIWYPKKFH